MYEQWHKKHKSTAEMLESMGMQPVFFIGSSLSMTEEDIQVKEINGVKYDVVNAIAAVGDIFYSGVFISADVLRKRVSNWNSTYNDINHFATSYPAFPYWNGTQNISYVTGFNKKAQFDESVKAVKLQMLISHNSPMYKDWRSFIDISIAAKRTPNVSIFGFAKFNLIDAKDLQKKGIKVPRNVVSGDGKVLNLEDITPFALTTCLKGKCDEKSGCGISANEENDSNEILGSPTRLGTCNSETCGIKTNTEEKNKNNDFDSDDSTPIESRYSKEYLKKRIISMKKK